MRRVVIAAALVLLVAAGGWWVLGEGASRPADGAREAEERAKVVKEVVKERAVGEAPGKPKATKRVVSKRERDAMRRRIVDALQARAGAAGERDGETTGGAAEAGAGAHGGGRPAAPDDETPTPGDLTDRTGNHGYLLKVMNEDLMPLADECYTLARETQPELAGMLVLNVDIIGDEDIGGVVEAVTPGQDNELGDPGLIECVRESLLSTTLPPPPEGGRDAVALSLRLGEE